ncbi:hypothetical protein NC652_014827 [Populus alba x Populus x berolinensis]|nr:hypothetical protein NC652_014827 [Populus alba x Populus x berolinensis]
MSMELNAFTTLDFLLYGGLGVPQLRDPFLTMGFACSLCFRCLATLESTDLANTQAIKLSRVLIHVYLCEYCPYGS